MFDKKVSSLISKENTTSENAFVKAALKATHETCSGNGSLKYDTSGDDFVDDFANIARYKEPRSYAEVSADMQRLWSQNPELALKMAVYIRTITRKTQYLEHLGMEKTETLKAQKGQGLKNEGIMRLLWIAINHPKTFMENICVFIAAGSWKDIITMLNLDLQYHGWDGRKLDWKFFKNIIYAGLANETQTHLVRKYLPTIRTNKKARTLEAQADTLIGRWLARMIWNSNDKMTAYKNYRQLKSQGVAHQWQQLISKELYNQIKFDKIAGRALQQLVNSKFLDNHGLRDKYTEWISSQKTAKYTGFVFELFKPIEVNEDGWRSYSYPEITEAQKATINAQFNHLVEVGKDNKEQVSKLLVVRDISGSMTDKAIGCGISSYSVAKALALYFSEFLTGKFAGCYAEFAHNCRMKEWKGLTPVDKWLNDTAADFGDTNFLSVAELFATLKRQGISESEFPEGVLCVSDGDFNDCGYWTTNFSKFRNILRDAGFSKEYVDNFKLILWDIPNTYYGEKKAQFEDFADAPNTYHMTGYDPAIISFLLDGGINPANSRELMIACLNQELLNKLKVID